MFNLFSPKFLSFRNSKLSSIQIQIRMSCCGEQLSYPPFRFSAVGPVTDIGNCCCKQDPPFNFCSSIPLFPRPTCYCEDWSTPCVTYQSSQNYHYLPSPLSGPRSKRLYFFCEPMIPGYSGHIPSYKYHSAGRTFGDATRDVGTVIQNREAPCQGLPDRIWEQ